MKRNPTFCYEHFFPGRKPGRDKTGNETHQLSPSEKVIRNILSYSKALFVSNTRSSGYISLVIN